MVDVAERGEGVYGGDDGWQREATVDTNEERDALVRGMDGGSVDSVQREDVDEDDSVDGYLYEDDESMNEYVDEYVDVDEEGVVDGHLDVYEDVRQVEEEVVSLIVSKLDTDGCLLKLYCNLQERPALTLEQHLLSQFFSSSSRARAAYTAALRSALEVQDTRDGKPLTCDRLFNKCDLQEDALEGLLSYTWQHQNIQA